MITYLSFQPPGYFVNSIRCSCELLRISQEQRRSCFLNLFPQTMAGLLTKEQLVLYSGHTLRKRYVKTLQIVIVSAGLRHFRAQNVKKHRKMRKSFFFVKFLNFRIFVELLKNFFIFYFLSSLRDDETTSKVLLPLKETSSIQKFGSYDGMTGLFTIFGLYFSFYLPA